jgi:HEPN domain-containing protein
MSAPEIIREWIDKAEEDAAVAEREGRVRKQPAPGAVCYHAQQCVEKYLKALLQEQAKPIPKSHDLPVLFEQCTLEHFAALIDREGLVSLSRYATRFRYPGEAANLSDAKQALLLMRRYRAILRGMLGIK